MNEMMIISRGHENWLWPMRYVVSRQRLCTLSLALPSTAFAALPPTYLPGSVSGAVAFHAVAQTGMRQSKSKITWPFRSVYVLATRRGWQPKSQTRTGSLDLRWVPQKSPAQVSLSSLTATSWPNSAGAGAKTNPSTATTPNHVWLFKAARENMHRSNAIAQYVPAWPGRGVSAQKKENATGTQQNNGE